MIRVCSVCGKEYTWTDIQRNNSANLVNILIEAKVCSKECFKDMNNIVINDKESYLKEMIVRWRGYD